MSDKTYLDILREKYGLCPTVECIHREGNVCNVTGNAIIGTADCEKYEVNKNAGND